MSKPVLLSRVVLALVGAALLATLTACAGSPGATLRVLSGSATVDGHAVGDPQRISAGSTVEVSGADALVEIQWADGAFTRFGDGTTFEVGGDGVRGTLDEGVAWNAVGPGAGPYAIGTDQGSVRAAGESTFAVRCASDCDGVAATGAVRLDGSADSIDAPASFRLGDDGTEPVGWDAVYADPWTAANRDRDGQAGIASPADTWEDRDPALASMAGDFSGERETTGNDCTGYAPTCAAVEANLFSRTGDVDYAFSSDCSSLPCAVTLERTIFSTDGSQQQRSFPLVFDGTSYSFASVNKQEPYCITGQGEEQGLATNNISATYMPSAAKMVDGVFTVTAFTADEHSDVVTTEPTTEPGCEQFEFEWFNEFSVDAALVEPAAAADSSSVGDASAPVTPISGPARPTVLSDLRSPAAAMPNLLQLGVLVGAVVVLVLVVAYPGYLLSRVVADRYDAVAGSRVAALRARIDGSPALRRVVVAAGLIVAAVVTAALDPSFGRDVSSLRMVLTALVAFVVFIALSAVVVRLAARRLAPGEKPALQFRWGSLLILVAGVVLSRVFGFSPGVVFGLVAGLVIAESLPSATRGRLTLIGSGFAMVLGLASWIAYGAIAPLAAADPQNAGLVAASELLSVLTIEAISTLPLALLPFAGMDGAVLRRWKLWIWVVAYVIAVALFLLVVIAVPASWAAIQGDAVRWAVIFAIFTVAALAIWYVNERARKRAVAPVG